MRKITAVHPLGSFRLHLHFDDGIEGSVDLSDLAGKGVFAIWNEPGVFQTVIIGDSGELIWGDHIDLCPDSLYLEVTNKKPEDLFPALNNESAHARG